MVNRYLRGRSSFAALNQVISLGPGLGIPVPPTAQAAATWLEAAAAIALVGRSRQLLCGRSRCKQGRGRPPAPYDPSIDPILACIYGAGIPPYDPRLLSTAAQVRAQWTEPAPAAYPINTADASIGIGPCIGRYNGDEYSGWSLTSNTGHPWVVCTCGFAQLYYELAAAINNGTPVPSRSTGDHVPEPDKRQLDKHRSRRRVSAPDCRRQACSSCPLPQQPLRTQRAVRSVQRLRDKRLEPHMELRRVPFCRGGTVSCPGFLS